MTVKHLVIGGGGPGGLINYGVIKKANLEKIWIYNNIETVYCTSVGTLIGLIILFNIDWSWSDDYLIKRPWNKLVSINNNDYLRVIREKGLFDKELIKKILAPLLNSVDLDITSTLQDLYNKFPKEWHCFTCNVNSDKILELINISYKTHPDLLIIEAVFMSCSIPILAKPLCKDDKCYVDGGFLANVPVNECLKETKCGINEIFAVKYYRPFIPSNINDKSSTWSYVMDVTQSLAMKLVLQNEENQNNQVCIVTATNLDKPLGEWKYWLDTLNSEDERNDLVVSGENSLIEFMNKNMDRIINLKINYNKKNLEYYGLYNNINKNLKRTYSF